MQSEPKELTEARALLGRFEATMTSPDSVTDLGAALSLLARIRENAPSNIAQTAANLALAYAKRAQAAVELLLAREPSFHWETVDHWQSVLTEFEGYGFSTQPEIAATRRKLLMRKMTKEITLMSAEERQRLIEELQALDAKRGN